MKFFTLLSARVLLFVRFAFGLLHFLSCGCFLGCSFFSFSFLNFLFFDGIHVGREEKSYFPQVNFGLDYGDGGSIDCFQLLNEVPAFKTVGQGVHVLDQSRAVRDVQAGHRHVHVAGGESQPSDEGSEDSDDEALTLELRPGNFLDLVVNKLPLLGVVADLGLDFPRVGEYLPVEVLVELVFDHLVDGVVLELLLVAGVGGVQYLGDVGLRLGHLEPVGPDHGLVVAHVSHRGSGLVGGHEVPGAVGLRLAAPAGVPAWSLLELEARVAQVWRHLAEVFVAWSAAGAERVVPELHVRHLLQG